MSAWINFKRVTKAGFMGFWRNGLVSFAAVFVMVVTISVIGSLIVGNALFISTLRVVEDKVDINVYLKTSAEEPDIIDLKAKLEALPETKSVEYINKEEALERFVEKNKGNQLINQALLEIGDNPLRAVLNIKAKETSQYGGIAQFLEERQDDDVVRSGSSIIDDVTYLDNKIVIDRLNDIINDIEKIGTTIAILLIAMTILVTFNTVRLAIYNTREEIGIMRLVGASNSFIRGPFIIAGSMYGIIGAFIALGLLFAAIWWLDSTASFYARILDLKTYYYSNFWEIFAIMILSGVLLGVVSSFISVRKYLDK